MMNTWRTGGRRSSEVVDVVVVATVVEADRAVVADDEAPDEHAAMARARVAVSHAARGVR
jgi:hypothetical protein